MARQPLAFKKSRNISGDASRTRRVCTCQNAKQILLFILAPLNCIAPAADKKIMSSAGVGCRSRGWWDSLGPERGVSATPGRGVVRNRVALILVCLARADV